MYDGVCLGKNSPPTISVVAKELLILVLLAVLMQRTVLVMESSSTTSKSGALIFLHGRGYSTVGWVHLQRSLPKLQPRLSNLEYVFPAAPTIPISINGGKNMSGWFDLYDWPIKVGSKDDPDGLDAGVVSVEQHVKALNDMGIPSDKIVVAGFSQGGAVALHTVYQSKTRYAGCVSLSGWLTLPDQLNVSEEAKNTPLYWGHGTCDDKVLFDQQPYGVSKLREQGVNVKAEVRPYIVLHGFAF
jgi:predicted esterase